VSPNAKKCLSDWHKFGPVYFLLFLTHHAKIGAPQYGFFLKITRSYLKYELYLEDNLPFKSKTKAEQESWPSI